MGILFCFYLQEHLIKECEDVMRFGLLHEVDGTNRPTLREQPTYLSFTHKSLQEFEAAKFVAKELEISNNVKVNALWMDFLF